MKIQIKLPNTQTVKLICYNTKGELIKSFIDNKELKKLLYDWDITDDSGEQLKSGLYWMALFYSNEKLVKQFIVIK